MKINKNMSIAEIIEKFPATKEYFEKIFGIGCFTCPGFKVEDITFAAAMHNMDPEAIERELNQLLQEN